MRFFELDILIYCTVRTVLGSTQRLHLLTRYNRMHLKRGALMSIKKPKLPKKNKARLPRKLKKSLKKKAARTAA
jgi:hypothetical protein